MTTTKLAKQQLCFKCGYKFDASTPAFEKKALPPKNGDYCLCLNCGTMGVFDNGLVRKPTADEFAAITASLQVMQAQVVRSAVVDKDLRR